MTLLIVQVIHLGLRENEQRRDAVGAKLEELAETLRQGAVGQTPAEAKLESTV